MLLIMNDGTSLDCGHCISDIFDVWTGIWWQCDDYQITEISDFREGVYTRESHKQIDKKRKFMWDSDTIMFIVYIIMDIKSP